MRGCCGWARIRRALAPYDRGWAGRRTGAAGVIAATVVCALLGVEMAAGDIRIGLFGIGLDTYWPQFAGLKDQLTGYQKRVHDRLARRGVEIVDAGLVDSIEKALRLVAAADTPWFQLYPDIGNLTAMQKDVTRELLLGGRHILGLHLKDTRIGEFRGIPFGKGIVDFDVAFRTLHRIGFKGPFMVEMWNEDAADAESIAAAARGWLSEKLTLAFST